MTKIIFRRLRVHTWDGGGEGEAEMKYSKKLVETAKLQIGGGLIGYVKSKPLGNGQIISIDVLVDVMIIAVFHKKLI